MVVPGGARQQQLQQEMWRQRSIHLPVEAQPGAPFGCQQCLKAIPQLRSGQPQPDADGDCCRRRGPAGLLPFPGPTDFAGDAQ